ncbi:hypothetical protein GCM10022287_36980 [Gryllotalpicola koreensis]|uniref:Histidine ammonia-lyase n=1 Tax=Gryllotalpicola koreensis TaxID=993086 RepID=A0ABP8AC36_9MICO
MTSDAVWPTETCMLAAIGTRAVAIIELLIGFSADPMNSGVVNRHENGVPGASSARGAMAAGILAPQLIRYTKDFF